MQQECHLSEGDAVQMVTAPASDATAANVVVKSSKGGVECGANVTVAVNLSDLQEMQNHMREQIDAGLKDMQSKGRKRRNPAASGLGSDSSKRASVRCDCASSKPSGSVRPRDPG